MSSTTTCASAGRGGGVFHPARIRFGLARIAVALLLAVAWSCGPVSLGFAEEPAPAPEPAAAPAPATAPAPAAAQAPASAPAPAPSANKWQIEITPYFWAAGMDGTAGVKGVTGDVDMGIGDIIDRLDGAFMGMVEVRKGAWGFAFDGGFMHLKAEQTREWQGPGGIGTATGNLTADATETIYNFAVARRVVDEAGGSKADLVFGARSTEVESSLNLDVSAGNVLPGGTRNVSDSESWLDPIVGLRLLFPFAKHWTVVGYADIGGFGVASDMTSQVLAGVNWEITKNFIAKVGYRYLTDDFSNDDFVWDIATQGPYAGVGIRF